MKRLVRSYAKNGEDFVRRHDLPSRTGDTVLRKMLPEIAEKSYGMDGEIKLGRNDLEKLGFPNRIKVVIYNIDD